MKNNRAPLLCCFKLCASFHSHRWIQTKVTVRKRSIRVKIGDFLSRMTLKFDEWPWNRETIGHLFYATSSFMHHFVAIGEFKLELQSGNAQFGSKSTIFRALKFDGWPWKQEGTSSKQHQALCIISLPYVNSNWSYGPETAKWGHDLCDLDLRPWHFAWTSRRLMVITPENFVMIRWWEHSEKDVTDWRTDRQTDRKKCSISCLVAAKNRLPSDCLTFIKVSLILVRWHFIFNFSDAGDGIFRLLGLI